MDAVIFHDRSCTDRHEHSGQFAVLATGIPVLVAGFAAGIASPGEVNLSSYLIAYPMGNLVLPRLLDSICRSTWRVSASGA